MSTSVSGVGSVSSAGIGSGLDVNTIVTQLMAVEQQPLKQLQTQASALNTQVSTFGQLQSLFSTLQDKSKSLADLTQWGATTATSADSSSVGVVTGTNATAGSYTVNVQHLASAQTVTAAVLPSASSTLSVGTLTIELGSWTGNVASPFQAKAGSPAVPIAIAAGQTSLTAIRDKINAAGAGVTATLITDASGARLSLRSTATGAENAFRITATEAVDDGNAATGLSVLGFDVAIAGSPMTRSETAVNAAATINGIAIDSASNTLSNVIDGLTLNLLKQTTGPVTVGVAADTATLKQKVADFVTAFNGLAGFIKTQTAYNAATKAAGTLQGDMTVNSLQRSLRDVLNQASTASSAFSRLSDVGITMKADGTLASDATKLDHALSSNLAELTKLFATSGADNASSGFAVRWKKLADAALGSGGSFDSRTTSLNSRLKSNGVDQDRMQNRLSQTEARMRAQYSALDTQMAKLNNLSNYMTQQLAQYNKSTA
jgi:flagellar hook-associated protein 2